MAYLQALELSNRGDCEGVITLAANGQPTMMAFVWMDRERWYFIANTSSLTAGSPYSRVRWRQIASVESNEPPVRTELSIPQPMAAELFYSVAATIDQHNHHRQDNLQLERKLGTKDWSLRVNFSILGMHIVDTWLAWKGLGLCEEGEREDVFYEYLAEELIENEYDAVTHRHRSQSLGQDLAASPDAIGRDGLPKSVVGAYLTPTKKKRQVNGVPTNYLAQNNCTICKAKTTYVCNGCLESELIGKHVFICHSKTGRDCFAKHKTAEHNS